ncbi:MAG: hypothetical protein BGO89_13640 [Candidatus Kapaibacterium thiocyanatum]|uniref:Uncharacterized protein n=1 Tax=Candidatus Kapaibacterium thiocyanatum TaxID=1895771 RepID=A0A1M3KVG0_9BACT|nr:MAG: hypothetical protein BGO89_13640 ['Candidatus Kapabacteria' thiocyanatum]
MPDVPELSDGTYALALGVETIFELENGGLSIGFVVDIKLVSVDLAKDSDEPEKMKAIVEVLKSESQVFAVLHVTVTTAFGVSYGDESLSAEAVSQLGRAWFRQQVTEAFATTRGYVSALLANTKFAGFTMPITDPDTFLGGDFGKVIDAGMLPNTHG